MRSAPRILTLAVIVIGSLSLTPVMAAADDTSGTDRRRLTVEVAEDGTRFVFDEEPVFDDGLPAYGNDFVTQGYIYPKGTLNGTNGVNPDGSPEFPELVIGDWTCWGFFIGDGAHTTAGPWVVTNQLFEFRGSVLGDNSIMTIGYEAPADAGPALRGVVGGTGRYLRVSGEVSQTTLGYNATEGVDATFDFVLRGVLRGRDMAAGRSGGIGVV